MSAPWVNACHPPVIPGTRIHTAAITPAVLWFLWWSWVMFYIVIFVTVGTITLQIKGRRFVWLLRRTKSRLRGGLVMARPNFYRRRRSRIESYEDLDIHAAYALVNAQPTGRSATAVKRAPTTSANQPKGSPARAPKK